MNTAPPVHNCDLALLETILSEHGDWLHARDIALHPRWLEAHPHLEGTRENWLAQQERKIRATASASAGSILSFSGSPGYRLRLAATAEEIQTAIAKLKHQGAEMMNRARAIETFGQQNAQLTLH